MITTSQSLRLFRVGRRRFRRFRLPRTVDAQLPMALETVGLVLEREVLTAGQRFTTLGAFRAGLVILFVQHDHAQRSVQRLFALSALVGEFFREASVAVLFALDAEETDVQLLIAPGAFEAVAMVISPTDV